MCRICWVLGTNVLAMLFTRVFTMTTLTTEEPFTSGLRKRLQSMELTDHGR
uniref:E4 n=1 Tax=Bos taurus papillomavirus 7 TaxID=1001533 RepID=A0A097A5Y5_9PAPI|nr:E4 [Bos taurus papillomavirus 7]